ncbi:MAG: SPOR domain-containing protein [Comamonadaceae bacterium]
MLRFLILSLLLFNGFYFAWTEGAFPALGPEQQAEPQRLQHQLRPQALRLLTGHELRLWETSSAVSGKSSACLQAGPFDEARGASLRAALTSALPPGSWTLSTVAEAGRWIVYMGKYASAEALAKKRAELGSLNLRFEPLTDPALQWGLSLGSFDTQAAADAALAGLNQRGVRTARVLRERAPSSGIMLRLPAADEAIRARLGDLQTALSGRALLACK